MKFLQFLYYMNAAQIPRAVGKTVFRVFNGRQHGHRRCTIGFLALQPLLQKRLRPAAPFEHMPQQRALRRVLQQLGFFKEQRAVALVAVGQLQKQQFGVFSAALPRRAGSFSIP